MIDETLRKIVDNDTNLAKIVDLFNRSSFGQGISYVGESEKFTPEQAKASLCETVDKTVSPDSLETIKYLINNLNGDIYTIGLIFGNGTKSLINCQLVAIAVNVLYYLLNEDDLYLKEIRRFLTEIKNQDEQLKQYINDNLHQYVRS